MWKQTVIDGSMVFLGVLIAGGVFAVLMFGFSWGQESVLTDCKRYGKHVERATQITCEYTAK